MQPQSPTKQNILTFAWFVSLTSLLVSAFFLYYEVIAKKITSTSSTLQSGLASSGSSSSNLDDRIFMVYIIVFSVIFAVLSYRNIKTVQSGTHEVEQNKMRILLSYVLMWISGLTIFASVISILYMLIGGEFDTAELCRMGLSFIAALAVFGYEYSTKSADQGMLSYKSVTTALTVFVVIFSLGSVITTAALVGSPVQIRKQAEDLQKVYEISSIQDDVVYYLQEYGEFPKKLSDLGSYNTDMKDYEYRVVSQPQFDSGDYTNATFEVCATFGAEVHNTKASTADGKLEQDPETTYWNHNAGRSCFSYTATSDKYPIYYHSSDNYPGY